MSESLEIALVTETHPPELNGVAMTVGRLVSGMRERGHRVSVVRPRQRRSEEAAHDEHLVGGLPLPGYPGLRFGLPAEAALKRRWTARRPHAVHVVTEGPLGWSALRAARALRLPVTSGYHTNFDHYSRHYGVGLIGPLVGGWLRRFHRRTDATLVPTPALAQSLTAQGVPGVAVVGRGVDTRLFTPARRDAGLRRAWGVENDALAVLYVGRLAPEKNLSLVERSFQRIADAHPDARMVWVGNGPSEGPLRRAHPRHHFAGPHFGEDLATHYASADLFLFPSLTETYGNVTVEAMASGLPVLAFDTAAAGLLIRDGENGRHVSPGDEAAYLDAAATLAADADTRRRLGEAARRSVLPLAWEAVIADFEQVLRGAIGRQG